MELLIVARLLWRRKWALLLGFAVAAALVVVRGGDEPTTSGLAWTNVVLDTPKSQLVNAAPSAAPSLPWRASLMTHLLATDAVTKELAAKVGVAPEDVRVVDPTQTFARVPASVPAKAAEAAAVNGSPYVLTAYMQNDSLAMITLEAAAPDVAGARRLADAAAAVLASQAPHAGTYSSPILTAGGKNELEAYTIRQAAPTRAQTVVSDKGPLVAIGIGVVLWLLWTATVLTVAAMLDWLRARRPPLPA